MTGSAQASGGRPRLRHRRLGVAATLLAAGGAITIGGSGTAAAQDAPDGEALYQANCASCHGAEGEGGVGPALQGIVDGHGREDVEQTIREGREGEPVDMPAWEGTLTDEEIVAVVDFVATLEGEHTHEHDDGHGDDHGDGHDDGGDHNDGHDHGEEPGTGTPAPPVAGDPGFTG